MYSSTNLSSISLCVLGFLVMLNYSLYSNSIFNDVILLILSWSSVSYSIRSLQITIAKNKRRSFGKSRSTSHILILNESVVMSPSNMTWLTRLKSRKNSLTGTPEKSCELPFLPWQQRGTCQNSRSLSVVDTDILYALLASISLYTALHW